MAQGYAAALLWRRTAQGTAVYLYGSLTEARRAGARAAQRELTGGHLSAEIAELVAAHRWQAVIELYNLHDAHARMEICSTTAMEPGATP